MTDACSKGKASDACNQGTANDVCSQGTVNVDNGDGESQVVLMIGNESRRVNVFRVDYVQKNERFDDLENGDASGFLSRKNRLLGVDSLLDPDL